MPSKYTAHQQRIIRNYYANLDALRAQRLAELAGEIYLAGSEKKRERLWERAKDLLLKEGAPPVEVEGIFEARDVEGLARLVERS